MLYCVPSDFVIYLPVQDAVLTQLQLQQMMVREAKA